MNVGMIVLGMGLMVLGVGVGVGLIGLGAVNATGRQPEAQTKIMTVMLVAAALIEGVGLLAIIVAMNAM